MPRPTVGAVTEHKGRDGRTYRSLKFTACGKRRRVPLGAVSATDAESALRHVIADVERGTSQPDTIEAPAEPERPARGDGRNGAHRPRARAAGLPVTDQPDGVLRGGCPEHRRGVDDLLRRPVQSFAGAIRLQGFSGLNSGG